MTFYEYVAVCLSFGRIDKIPLLKDIGVILQPLIVLHEGPVNILVQVFLWTYVSYLLVKHLEVE